MEVESLHVDVIRPHKEIQVDAKISGKFVRNYESCDGGYVSFESNEAHIFWRGTSYEAFNREWPQYLTVLNSNLRTLERLYKEAMEVYKKAKEDLNNFCESEVEEND